MAPGRAPLGPGLLGGLKAPLAAWSFLWRNPRLLPLAAAPFLINLALFVLAFWLGYGRLSGWVRSWLPEGQGWWWALAGFLLGALVGLFLLAAMVYVFALVGGVIASPFLEALTRRVEDLASPQARGQWQEVGFLAEILRVAGQSLKKLLLYLAVMLLLLLLNLLPGLGTGLYALAAFIATCFFLALEFLDYPLDRRGLKLGGKLSYLKGLGLTGLGFGAGVLVLGIIPLLNLLLLPLAAVGGTLLYLDSQPSPPLPPFDPTQGSRPAV